MRIAEPFVFVVGLGLLSAGVVEVVETRVPTRADQEDSARLARAQPQVSAEQRTSALELAAVWQTSDLPDWQVAAPRATPEPPDHSTTSINSTSKTSAEPPGMVGDGLASP